MHLLSLPIMLLIITIPSFLGPCYGLTPHADGTHGTRILKWLPCKQRKSFWKKYLYH